MAKAERQIFVEVDADAPVGQSCRTACTVILLVLIAVVLIVGGIFFTAILFKITWLMPLFGIVWDTSIGWYSPYMDLTGTSDIHTQPWKDLFAGQLQY